MEMQLSMFDMIEEEPLIDRILKYGSGYAGGAIRITAAAEGMQKDDFVSWLKEEFGTGGHSCFNGMFDHGPAGCVYREWKTRKSTKWSWKQIADVYLRMIAKGSFPDAKSLMRYREIRQEYAENPAPRMDYPPAEHGRCYGCRKYDRLEGSCRMTGKHLSGFTKECADGERW